MIWLGPAGIPTVSKDRSTLGGIRTVSELKLNAMEIQYVRGVKMNVEMAKRVGELAKELGIKLSIHAPYYINLCSKDRKKLEASKRFILDSAERAHVMGADIVTFHPGYYQKLSPKEALEAVKDACSDIVDRLTQMGVKNVKISLETMGKQATFGTLEELIEICKEVKGCSLTLDFAHLNCRCAGCIRTQEDYAKILTVLESLKLDHLHTHFTCAEYSQVATGKGNERYHLELKANKPPFEPLAKEILKRKLSVTIISESPVLEQDSLKQKKIFEKLGYKF